MIFRVVVSLLVVAEVTVFIFLKKCPKNSTMIASFGFFESIHFRSQRADGQIDIINDVFLDYIGKAKGSQK